MSTDRIDVTLTFPLPDGRALVKGPLTYNTDGLATKHNADFVRDPLFAAAYGLGASTGHQYGPNLHVEWRVYTACWIASNAIRLPGDFVECGVATGIISRAITHYVGWERFGDRTFWLLDTFDRYPAEQLNAQERQAGLGRLENEYHNSLDGIRKTFADYPNVRIIPGMIPSTLDEVKAEKIAYLHLDCNAVTPERAAIERFWPRLVSGAWILFDDYGWTECINQKVAMDQFAAAHGLSIFSMPTGQGILIKP
jgi:hypothetical protein